MATLNSFIPQFLTKLLWCNMDEIMKKFLPWYETHKGRIASVAFVTPKGLVFSDNHACHAGLSCTHVAGKDAKITTVISGFQFCEASEADKRLFINYMLNDSPWKEVFINKDVDHVLKNHWWVDATVPSNFLANALVATRLPTEFPQRFRVFIDAVKEGVSGDEAYIMSMLLNKSSKNYNWSLASGHICFNTSPIQEVYKRFVNHTPKDMGQPYNKVQGYNSNNGVWGPDYGGGNKGQDLLFRIVPESMTVAKNLNIFYKPPKGIYGYAFREGELKNLAKQMKEALFA